MSMVNFAQPDVTLMLDLSGVIRRATLSGSLAQEPIDGWLGRPWMDTVADGGTVQVQRMLADARSAGVSFFHQVRQRFPSGLELALDYTTVRLGESDGLLAIGRNLEAVAELRSRLVAAQKSMERDYWKLREVETRYRLLFDASNQPVLLLSAEDTRIVEANPAAIRAFGLSSDRALLPELLPTQRDGFLAMLARVRDQGKAPGILLHLGPDRQPWLVRASLIAVDPTPVFILQLSAGVPRPSLLAADGSGVPIDDLLARLPDAFAVIDDEGELLRANRTFFELVGLSERDTLGQRLGRFLVRPEADAATLLSILKRQPTLSRFRTALLRESGDELPVELTAAGSADENSRYIGLLLRPLAGPSGLPETALSPAERVGKATLREIVQSTIASVEQRCIAAALERAKGNRTVAAELLGLSRQSLYAKLVRYASDDDDTPVGDQPPGEG